MIYIYIVYIYICYTYIQAKSEQCTMVSTADEILPGYTASQTEANKNISGCLTSRSLPL